MEHFGPGTEQLDIYSEYGRVSLTSYTDKIVSGSGKFVTAASSKILTCCRDIETAFTYYNRD